MRDSIIPKFIGFKAWGDKAQSKWAVAALPGLYQTEILNPLRKDPSSDTLAAWNTYITMRSIDETDNDQWNQTIFPPLQFERACDDYAITPSTEKLEALVKLVKASASNPNADDWNARVRQMVKDYSAGHGGKTGRRLERPGTDRDRSKYQCHDRTAG